MVNFSFIYVLILSFALVGSSGESIGYIDSLSQICEKAISGISFERDYTLTADPKTSLAYDLYRPQLYCPPAEFGYTLALEQVHQIHIKLKGSLNPAKATGNLEIYLGFNAPATELALKAYLLEDGMLYIHKDSLAYLNQLATRYPKLLSLFSFGEDEHYYVSTLLKKLNGIEYLVFDLNESVFLTSCTELTQATSFIKDLLTTLPTLPQNASSLVTQEGDSYTFKLNFKTLLNEFKNYRNQLLKFSDNELLDKLTRFNTFLLKYKLLDKPIELADIIAFKKTLSHLDDKTLDEFYTIYTYDHLLEFDLTSTVSKENMKSKLSLLLQGRPLITLSSTPIKTVFSYTPIDKGTIDLLKHSSIDPSKIPLKYAAISLTPGATKGYLLDASRYEVIDLFNLENTYYAPAQAVGKRLGAQILWDAKSKSAYVLVDNTKISLQGRLVKGSSTMKEGYYIKLRELEKLGFQVYAENNQDSIILHIYEGRFDSHTLVTPETKIVLVDNHYVEVDPNKQVERFRKVLTKEDLVLLTTDTDADYLSDFVERYLIYTDGVHTEVDWNNPDCDDDGLLDGEEVFFDLTDFLFTTTDTGEKVLKYKPGDVLIFYSSLNNEGYMSIESR